MRGTVSRLLSGLSGRAARLSEWLDDLSWRIGPKPPVEELPETAEAIARMALAELDNARVIADLVHAEYAGCIGTQTTIRRPASYSAEQPS